MHGLQEQIKTGTGKHSPPDRECQPDLLSLCGCQHYVLCRDQCKKSLREFLGSLRIRTAFALPVPADGRNRDPGSLCQLLHSDLIFFQIVVQLFMVAHDMTFFPLVDFIISQELVYSQCVISIILTFVK